MKYDNKRRKKSTMTKKKGKGQRLSINAIDNTNKTLYVNEQTTFTCFMENLNGTTYHSKNKVPIDISLVYASNPSESSDVEYDVVENNPITISNINVNDTNSHFLDTNGQGTFQIAINALSADHSNREFCIMFQLKGDAFADIEPAITAPIKTVKYKFVITTPISATCANTKEKGDGDNVFYKDQGGKLRTMECTLQLQKLGNVNVLSEKIALKLTLYYEDKTEVSNQEILQIPIMVQEQCFIENGTFQLKFRIEDVSKNHGKKKFCVLISPTDEAIYHNCAPVFTESVLIKSKKNKVKQHTPLENLTAGSLSAFSMASDLNNSKMESGGGGGGSSSNSNGNNNNNVKNNKANLLDLGTYKMDEILRKQINSGKMNMNLAASALIQYSAKTTMCLNAMMQIQKQFQNEFHKYVEPSITFLVEEIQKQRSHAQNVTNSVNNNNGTSNTQQNISANTTTTTTTTNNNNSLTNNNSKTSKKKRKRMEEEQQVNTNVVIDATNMSLSNDQIAPPSMFSRGSSMKLFTSNENDGSTDSFSSRSSNNSGGSLDLMNLSRNASETLCGFNSQQTSLTEL